MSSDQPLVLTRRSLILAGLLLAGCGFRPVYGTNGVAQQFRDSVAVTAPDTPDGYALRQRVQDRLGRADSPRFDLDVTITIGQESGAIAADNSATRISLPGQAGFRLTDGAGAVIADGTVSSFTSYSTTSTTVATRAAAADARARLMTILADMIVTQMMAAATIAR